MAYKIPVLEKEPSDSRLYDIDFTGLLGAAETVSSVSSLTVSPTGPTLGSSVASGKRVQFRASGGTAGAKYKITAVVVTSASNTIEGDVYLNVLDT